MSRVEGFDSGWGGCLDSDTDVVTGFFRTILERFDTMRRDPHTLAKSEFFQAMVIFSIFDKCVSGVWIVGVLYSSTCPFEMYLILEKAFGGSLPVGISRNHL